MPADLWVPFQFDLNSQDMAHYFTVAARLRPGVTLPQANAQLRLAADENRRIYGETLCHLTADSGLPRFMSR